MKAINKIEIVGIGNITLLTIKASEKTFNPISKEGKELKAKREGSLTYYWEDSKGNRYERSDVFYEVAGQKVQKVNRTEKVKSFEVVDKLGVYDFLTDGFYVVGCDETTRGILNKKLNGDKAIRFLLKKSSRGFKWVWAYIIKWGKQFVVYTGKGTITEGVKEFEKLQQKAGKKEIITSVVEVASDSLEKEIASLI